MDRRTAAGGATSLHRAAFMGHVDVLHALCVAAVVRRCSINALTSRRRVLCRLAHGADASLQDADGDTALHKAAAQARGA